MLPVSPAVFNIENVMFKEFSELSSLGQMMFSNFLYDSYEEQDKEKLFPWKETPEEVLHYIRTQMREENVWVVYYDEQIVGFWCLTEIDGDLTVFSYLCPEHQNGDFDFFYLGFFNAVSSHSKTDIMLSLANLTNQQKFLYTGSESPEELLNIQNLNHSNKESDFSALLTFIKPYYS